MGSQVQLFDDLDDTIREDVQTIEFTYGDTQYAIDLGIEHRVELDEALAKFIGSARIVSTKKRAAPAKVPSEATAAPARTQSGNAARNSRIRTWARENGHEVLDGGRIKGDIIREYEAANPDDTLDQQVG